MIVIVYVAGVLAAVVNAIGAVVQRRATRKSASSDLFSRQFFISVTTNKLFIYGMGLQILGTVFQAVALSQGPLSVVAPLLTLNLVFILLILRFYFQQPVQAGEWLSMVAVVVGLGLLLLVMQPRKETAEYAVLPWIIATAIVGIIVVVSSLVVTKVQSHNLRAAFAAFGAAATFGLNAGYIKLVLVQFSSHGIVTVLTSWPLYVLIVSGLLSLYLIENAFAAGPIVVSQPIMQVGEPTVSVLIGIMIFHEVVNHSAVAIITESVGVLLLSTGITRLATAKTILHVMH